MNQPSTDPLDRSVFERLRFLRDEEHDYLSELIATYLDSAPQLLDTLHATIARGDVLATQKTAHTLKGSSASLGAATLAAHCRELEMLARAGTLAGAAEWLQKIESEYTRVKPALEKEQRGKRAAN
ncbi:MAG: Hpt domain-containing protein [Anaerolineales bacterium]|nr:Hpt domain-containing protein [Anaerolineales bacterium]